MRIRQAVACAAAIAAALAFTTGLTQGASKNFVPDVTFKGVEPVRMAAARRSEVAGGERRDHRDAQRRQRMADSREVLPGRRVLLRVPLRARMHGGAAAPRREDGRRRVERHLRLAQRGGSRLVSRHARSPGQGDIPGAPAAGRRRAGSSGAAAGRRRRTPDAVQPRPWRGGRASGTPGRWSGFPANARRHARADSSPVERDEGR